MRRRIDTSGRASGRPDAEKKRQRHQKLSPGDRLIEQPVQQKSPPRLLVDDARMAEALAMDVRGARLHEIAAHLGVERHTAKSILDAAYEEHNGRSFKQRQMDYARLVAQLNAMIRTHMPLALGGTIRKRVKGEIVEVHVEPSVKWSRELRWTLQLKARVTGLMNQEVHIEHTGTLATVNVGPQDAAARVRALFAGRKVEPLTVDVEASPSDDDTTH